MSLYLEDKQGAEGALSPLCLKFKALAVIEDLKDWQDFSQRSQLSRGALSLTCGPIRTLRE